MFSAGQPLRAAGTNLRLSRPAALSTREAVPELCSELTWAAHIRLHWALGHSLEPLILLGRASP